MQVNVLFWRVGAPWVSEAGGVTHSWLFRGCDGVGAAVT